MGAHKNLRERLAAVTDERLDFLISIFWDQVERLTVGLFVIIAYLLTPYSLIAAALLLILGFVAAFWIAELAQAINEEYCRRNNLEWLPDRYAKTRIKLFVFFIAAVLLLGALRLLLPPM